MKVRDTMLRKILMPNPFAAYVDRHDPAGINLLPLMHALYGRNFEMVLTSGAIEPSDCPALKETLLYTFYGRPAFRVVPGAAAKGANPQTQAHNDPPHLPVCFLLSERLQAGAKYRFPFDSGAFIGGIYDGVFTEKSGDRRVDCLDNLLSNSPESLQKYIKAFFGTNENYWRAKTLPPMLTYPNMTVDRFHSFLLNHQQQPSDDRRMSAEVVF